MEYHAQRRVLEGQALEEIERSTLTPLQKIYFSQQIMKLWGKTKCCRKLLLHDENEELSGYIQLMPGVSFSKAAIGETQMMQYAIGKLERSCCRATVEASG